jgi:hypothetical protein
MLSPGVGLTLEGCSYISNGRGLQSLKDDLAYPHSRHKLKLKWPKVDHFKRNSGVEFGMNNWSG